MNTLGLSDFSDTIRKAFSFSDIEIDSMSHRIIDNFEKSFLHESLFLKSMDTLEKGGRRGNIGEIRIWNNKKYQKTVHGWKPMKGEMQQTSKIVDIEFDENLIAKSPRQGTKAETVLNALKEKRGLSVSQIARELNVSPTFVSNIRKMYYRPQTIVDVESKVNLLREKKEEGLEIEQPESNANLSEKPSIAIVTEEPIKELANKMFELHDIDFKIWPVQDKIKDLNKRGKKVPTDLIDKLNSLIDEKTKLEDRVRELKGMGDETDLVKQVGKYGEFETTRSGATHFKFQGRTYMSKKDESKEEFASRLVRDYFDDIRKGPERDFSKPKSNVNLSKEFVPYKSLEDATLHQGYNRFMNEDGEVLKFKREGKINKYTVSFWRDGSRSRPYKEVDSKDKVLNIINEGKFRNTEEDIINS